MRPTGRRVVASLSVAAWLAATSAPFASSQEPSPAAATPPTTAARSLDAEHDDLAKKLQNPFADLITFPLQNVTSLGVGPSDGTGNVLNLQPVVPVHLTPSLNLLARPILPISYTSLPDSQFGLGDLNLEPFLSPRAAGGLEWGAGVILGVPTATASALGTGKWTAGPSLAFFAIRGHWTLSLIANQQWSYAGSSARDKVSLLQLQPSLCYILGHGWFLTSGPLIAADWTEPSGQQWTVPVGAGVGKVFTVRKQKLNLQLEAYANAVRPDDGPESLVLLTVTFLFPR